MNVSAIKNTVFAVVAALGAWLANALGGWDAPLQVLLWMMGIDIACGILVAAVCRRSNKSTSGAVDSRAMFKGLSRKVAVLLLVMLATQLERAVGTNFVRTAVLIFYVANEGLSVIENLCLLGVPHPKFLNDALQVLRERGDKGDLGEKN